jgi:hypothetical protein
MLLFREWYDVTVIDECAQWSGCVCTIILQCRCLAHKCGCSLRIHILFLVYWSNDQKKNIGNINSIGQDKYVKVFKTAAIREQMVWTISLLVGQLLSYVNVNTYAVRVKESIMALRLQVKALPCFTIYYLLS